MPQTERDRALVSKFRKYEDSRGKGKKFYDRSDALLLEIAQELKGRKKPLRLDGDTVLECVDNAAGTQLVIGWAHACLRRYELRTRKA